MQTLIPQPARGSAKPVGRTGRLLGFGLTPLALLLFCVGLLLLIPAFFHAKRLGFMFGWDALLAILILIDLLRLPKPEAFTVTRTFLDSPQIGQATKIALAVHHEEQGIYDVRLVDELHISLIGEPPPQRVEAFPREDAVSTTTIYPRERGDLILGRVFLRYRGAFRLIERWAAALPVERNGHVQQVRIYPAHEDSRNNTQFYLLRARQIDLQRRRLRMRGIGREFESLRDYQQGDELRNISWTATARRGRLVTRQFTMERSQQVWVMIDAGRLSRTAFELKRGDAPQAFAETDAERERAHLLTVTQLDQAASAATMLAQVIGASGDKFAMMAYGRGIQQALTPGAGTIHTRLLLDLLSQTKAELSEADHLQAVARVKRMQRRRGLMVWITELVDSVGTPELVTAAAELTRRHLVVLVLLKHPELDALAGITPKNQQEMFQTTAAQEMLERRREAMAQLERQGVLIVETSAEEIGVQAVSKYLEVKAKGML